MSLIVCDAPCTFTPVNTKEDENPFLEPITVESAKRAGKGLENEDCVSLAFLLLHDIDNALETCKLLEKVIYIVKSSVGMVGFEHFLIPGFRAYPGFW